MIFKTVTVNFLLVHVLLVFDLLLFCFCYCYIIFGFVLFVFFVCLHFVLIFYRTIGAQDKSVNWNPTILVNVTNQLFLF